MPDRLSLPPSFSKSAEKLGWNSLNYRIQANSIHTFYKKNYRITFWIDDEDTKMWDLHRYSRKMGGILFIECSTPGQIEVRLGSQNIPSGNENTISRR